MTFVTQRCFIFLNSMLTPSYPHSGFNGRGSGIYQGQVIKGTRPDLRENIRVSCQPTVHFFGQWERTGAWKVHIQEAWVGTKPKRFSLWCERADQRLLLTLWWSNQKIKTHHNWLFMILEKTIMPASAGKEGLRYQGCYATPVDCRTKVNHVFFF